MRVPVNSFEFHSCERTPQVVHLSHLLRHRGSTPHTQWTSFTARTTRVSNPVCSPSFRASVSVLDQRATFVIGIPTNIYEFHLYTCSSALLFHTLDYQFQSQSNGWAATFQLWLNNPPRRPLYPVIPDNACDIRITAAAGTYLAVASSAGTVTCFFPAESTLQPESLHRAHRIAGSDLWSIVQYSPLLPPVGVRTVSQFPCGRPPSQAGYLSSPWWAITSPTS